MHPDEPDYKELEERIMKKPMPDWVKPSTEKNDEQKNYTEIYNYSMIMSKVISPIEQLYSICNEYKSNVRLKKTKTPEYQQCIMDIFAIKEKCDEH